MKPVLEVCTHSVESAVSAERGGAMRLELCANLMIGGTSPDEDLFRMVRERVSVPVRVLLRPRCGDFLYTESEFELLCRQVKRFAALGAGGIDLQLLGMGLNGHIGFNEPDEYFSKGTHCVNLTESTIEANKRFFASADDVPRQAYTMGVQTIMLARRIVLVVSGENKAETVREAFFGPVTPQVPASILQLHTDVSIVADEAALSKCGDLL